MKLITIATILSLLLGGGITAVAAQDSLPGDLLYPVKTLVEDIELGLVTDPETEFDVAFKHTIRRAEEIQQIIEEGIELPKDYPLQFQFRLNRDIEETIEAALATEDPIGNLLKIQQQLGIMHMTQQMNQGEIDGPFENKNSETYKLQYYMDLIDAGIEEPELLASELEFMAKYSKQYGEEKLEDAWMYLYMNQEGLVEGNVFSQQTQNQGAETQVGPFMWLHQQGDVLSEVDPNQFGNFGEDKNSTYDHLNAGDNDNGNNGGNGGSGGNGGK